ncbi:DUF2303 family protein [Sphingobium phenoxybenzoativorans]|uniref:DUF2303 family protein n=1 Tax=Sphingobium phenoxybenzoativorans TaxID=1592790 RepID=A0A975K343_9SPHN|nr:DUF2303 family protein [Sphingobium phenoxybenzoativorans]QUT04028.1 DUF2303 family protein [Sphingobium phenoxybenzoativorans]
MSDELAPPDVIRMRAEGIGETIEQAILAAEAYQKPTMVLIEEPGTGLQVPALISKTGIIAVGREVFDNFRDGPTRRGGTAAMTRLDSFIDHVNRFKDNDSALFARDDRKSPGLLAVLDYHQSRVDGEGVFLPSALPRFGKHRTSFAFPLSDEWKTWTAASGTVMSMVEFSLFLENNVVDIDYIDDPSTLDERVRHFMGTTGLDKIASPSRLLELAKGLQINEDSVVKQVQNLQTGEGQIRFESSHTDGAGAPVDVPGLFVICIPVFAHDGFYRIPARLRYRKKADGIVFWFDLWNTDAVFDDAFVKACERAKVETALPLFIGAPE